MTKRERFLFNEQLTDEQKEEFDSQQRAYEEQIGRPTPGDWTNNLRTKTPILPDWQPSYLVGNSFRDVQRFHNELLQKSKSTDPKELLKDKETALLLRFLAEWEETRNGGEK